MTDQTSIVEMRRRADGSVFKRDVDDLLTPDRVERYPIRDIDKLEATLRYCVTAVNAAEVLDTNVTALKRWAAVYGLDYSQVRGQPTPSERLRQAGLVGDD
jgi:hypothetical protein